MRVPVADREQPSPPAAYLNQPQRIPRPTQLVGNARHDGRSERPAVALDLGRGESSRPQPGRRLQRRHREQRRGRRRAERRLDVGPSDAVGERRGARLRAPQGKPEPAEHRTRPARVAACTWSGAPMRPNWAVPSHATRGTALCCRRAISTPSRARCPEAIRPSGSPPCAAPAPRARSRSRPTP